MANSVKARFNDNCKIEVAMSDDTTVTKAVIIDADGVETNIGGGGGGDFSQIFPVEAHVIINASSLPDFEAQLCEFSSETVGVHDYGEEGYQVANPTYGLSVQTGENKYVLFTTQDFGIELEPNFTNWDISVSGDATIDEEEGYKWITITGDCTITAEFIGTP